MADSDGDFHTDEETDDEAIDLKDIASTPVAQQRDKPPTGPPTSPPNKAPAPMTKSAKKPTAKPDKPPPKQIVVASDTDEDSDKSAPLVKQPSAASTKDPKEATAVYRGTAVAAEAAVAPNDEGSSETDDDATPLPIRKRPEPSPVPVRTPPTGKPERAPPPAVLSPESPPDFAGLMKRFFFDASGGESHARVGTLLISLKQDAEMRALSEQEYLTRDEAELLVFLSHLRADDPVPLSWGEFRAMQPRFYSDDDESSSSTYSSEDTPARKPSKAGRGGGGGATRQMRRPAAVTTARSGRNPNTSVQRRNPPPPRRSYSMEGHTGTGGGAYGISPSQRSGGVTGSAKAAQLEARRRAAKVLAMKARRTAPAPSPKLHYLAHTKVLNSSAPHISERSASPSPVAVSSLRELRGNELPASRRTPLISPAPEHEGNADSYISALRERIGSPPRVPSSSAQPSAQGALEGTEMLCLQTFISQQREIIKGLEDRLRDADAETREARRQEQKARKRERKAAAMQQSVETKLLQMSHPDKLKKLLRKHEERMGTTSTATTPTPTTPSPAPTQPTSPPRICRSTDTQTTPPSSPTVQRTEVSSQPLGRERGEGPSEGEKAALRRAEQAESRLDEAMQMMESADAGKEAAEKAAAEARRRCKEAEAGAEQLSRDFEGMQKESFQQRLAFEEDLRKEREQHDAALNQVDHHKRVLALLNTKYPGISKACCARCGKFAHNLQLRKHGLKCANCLGKKTKKGAKKDETQSPSPEVSRRPSEDA